MLLRSTFIRPEDLYLYQSLGFNRFKLVDRNQTTPWIIRVAAAYHAQRFDGNLGLLLSLCGPYQGTVPSLERESVALHRPFDVQELKRQGAFALIPQIDNRTLDGFIATLTERRECDPCNCSRCDVCRDIAEKVIVFPPEAQRILRNIELIIARLNMEGLQADE